MSLRALLSGPEIVVAPGVYDGLTAMLVSGNTNNPAGRIVMQKVGEALGQRAGCHLLPAPGAARRRARRLRRGDRLHAGARLRRAGPGARVGRLPVELKR